MTVSSPPAAALADWPDARLSRTERTRLELLDVSERLFARHGIEGVSLRQIAQEAGKANTNVVQYHFQSKENLLRELLRWRVLSMEAPRAEMLARAKASGRQHDVRTLLEIMCLPLLDAVDREGNRSFARVLGEYLFRLWPRVMIHPADNEPETVPALTTAIALLHQRLCYMPAPVVRMRSSTCLGMFINNLDYFSDTSQRDQFELTGDVAIAECMEMMVATMFAPLAPGTMAPDPLQDASRVAIAGHGDQGEV